MVKEAIPFSLHFKQHRHRDNQPFSFLMDSTRVGYAVLWPGTDRKDRRDQAKSSTDTSHNILTILLQSLRLAPCNCNWNCSIKTKNTLYYLRHFGVFFSSLPTSPTPPLHPMDFEYLLHQIFLIRFVCISGSSFPNIKGQQGEGSIRSPILKCKPLCHPRGASSSQGSQMNFALNFDRRSLLPCPFLIWESASSFVLLPNPFHFKIVVNSC